MQKDGNCSFSTILSSKKTREKLSPVDRKCSSKDGRAIDSQLQISVVSFRPGHSVQASTNMQVHQLEDGL